MAAVSSFLGAVSGQEGMHGAADKGAGKEDRTDNGRSFTFIGDSTIK
jgi:hypothetical protein